MGGGGVPKSSLPAPHPIFYWNSPHQLCPSLIPLYFETIFHSKKVSLSVSGSSALDLLVAASQIHSLQQENTKLVTENNVLKEENKNLRKKCETLEGQQQELSIEKINRSSVKDVFQYYTGLPYVTFLVLFNFLVPNERENPVKYSEKHNACSRLALKEQLLLVLCRLRNGFHLKDLAFRFNISSQVVSVTFNSWIQFMYKKLGYLSLWPHREVIMNNMSSQFKADFPNTLAIIDCTELKTETPSSLSAQSQLYSEYKSSTTLKALVVTDSRGSFMFSSPLFTGSISDKEICEKGGFFDVLKDLLKEGFIQEGDSIMADKGFRIDKELAELKLKLNIPPFSTKAGQMSASDVNLTRKIAKHRIHVERIMSKIKNFKLLSRKIPVTLFSNINEIWMVCCYLTSFQNVLVKVN